MDCENQEKDKDGNATAPGVFNNGNTNNSECRGVWSWVCGSPSPPDDVLCSNAGIQTIDSTQALFLPIGASVSLLVMFFFFDSVQVVFTICTAGETSLLFVFFFCFFLYGRLSEVPPSGGEVHDGVQGSHRHSALLHSSGDHRVCVPAAADVPVPDQTLLPTEQVSHSVSNSFVCSFVPSFKF